MPGIPRFRPLLVAVGLLALSPASSAVAASRAHHARHHHPRAHHRHTDRDADNRGGRSDHDGNV